MPIFVSALCQAGESIVMIDMEFYTGNMIITGITVTYMQPIVVS